MERGLLDVLEERRTRWKIGFRGDDDPTRGHPARGDQPNGETRVVRARGAGADHDRVEAGAESVNLSVGFVPGDPRALARPGGDHPVEAHGELQGDERIFVAGCMVERRVLGPCGALVPQGTLDRDARRSQRGAPAALGRPRLRGTVDHPHDTCPDQRPRARRRPTRVVARFETDVCRRSSRVRSSLLECDDLGVGSAQHLVMAGPDDGTVLDQHASDHGVRVHPTPPESAEGPRVVQVGPVARGLVAGRGHARAVRGSPGPSCHRHRLRP